MIYSVRINKRVKYIRVYTVVKHIGQTNNPLTKLFVKLLTKKPKES